MEVFVVKWRLVDHNNETTHKSMQLFWKREVAEKLYYSNRRQQIPTRLVVYQQEVDGTYNEVPDETMSTNWTW